MSFKERPSLGLHSAPDKLGDIEIFPPTVENLVVVRHGKYDSTTDKLTELGIKQLTDLGKSILRETIYRKGISALILHSDTIRARESAKILASVLEKSMSVSVSLHKLLLPDPLIKKEPDFEEVLGVFRSKGATINIAITHSPYCAEIFSKLHVAALRSEPDLSLLKRFDEGEGVMISRSTKAVRRLP